MKRTISGTAVFFLTLVAAQAQDLILTPNLPPSQSPLDPVTLTMRFTQPVPVALNGILRLSFTPDSSLNLPAGYRDPALLFANGTMALSFTVPAGATNVNLPNNGAFQPGTVAGTIFITLTELRQGNTVIPLPGPFSAFVQILPIPPAVIPSSLGLAGNGPQGFFVEFSGFSTVRNLQGATIRFLPASGSQLNGETTFTVPLNQQGASYFASSTGLNNGSRFSIRIPFNLSGDLGAIGGVAVTLSNSMGEGNTAQGTR